MKAALVLLLVGTAILFVEATVSYLIVKNFTGNETVSLCRVMSTTVHHPVVDVTSETLKESKDLLAQRYGKFYRLKYLISFQGYGLLKVLYAVCRDLLALMAPKDPLELQEIKENLVMMENLANLVNQERQDLGEPLEDA